MGQHIGARIAAFARQICAFDLDLGDLAARKGGFQPSLHLVRAQAVPIAAQLFRIGKAQMIQRRPTGPIDHGGFVGGVQAMRLRDHPFGQIIDLLEAVAPGDRQLPSAPQPFQRGFAGVPIPPATFAARLALTNIGRGYRTIAGNPI